MNLYESIKKNLLEEENDVLYTIEAHSFARVYSSVARWGDKVIAFTNKDEAVKCRKALDDSNGNVNNFVSYSISTISKDYISNCIVFETYEEYKQYTDKELADKNAREEKENEIISKVRDDIIDKLKQELSWSGFIIRNTFDDCTKYNEVYVEPSLSDKICIGAGLGHGGFCYGSFELKVSKDGLITQDDYNYSVIHGVPYDECKDKILKDVKDLCDKSKKNGKVEE